MELKGLIDEIHVDFPGYGYRRIKPELEADGGKYNWKRIRRVMRQYGLFPILPRAFRPTTDSRHKFHRYENLLPKLADITAPNTVWGSDITYIRIASGFVYLAVILDLYSRKVVGWHVGDNLEAEGCLTALERALANLPADRYPIHHSDRGCQYTSDAYQQTLKLLGITCSMSRRGCCYDNAVMERFFWSLKYEWTNHERFANLEEARLSVFKYIETFYNPIRLHETLNYLSPDTYEAENAPAVAA